MYCSGTILRLFYINKDLLRRLHYSNLSFHCFNMAAETTQEPMDLDDHSATVVAAAAPTSTPASGGLDDDSEGDMLTLESKTGQKFQVKKKDALISVVVKTSLEQDADSTEVPVPSVESATLELIIEYMGHHAGVEPELVEKPLRSKKMRDVCKDPWDADYVDRISKNRQSLYDLILAANYMDVKSLLHLGCAKVAALIKGKPVESIRDVLDPAKPHNDDDVEETKVETKA